ncbi:hypothetical protein E8E12_003453 [Didymella heteroderae]|uniref:Uncharacterized protein n=1 Tax=Didymella heteroderae TaxID=1769908 RepID=A0A9P5BY39_9PLEO|nr:hypothetical protein E8E12_003453 [Didymella heteroderae]
MESVRRSGRVSRPIGTKPKKPKPLPVQPFHEDTEKWKSPLPACQQIAVHGHVPSSISDTKWQTQRGAWVSRRKCDRWADTKLPKTATAPKLKCKRKTPEKEQPKSHSPTRKNSIHQLVAQDSDATLSEDGVEHTCSLGLICELSKRRKFETESSANTSRTVSPAPEAVNEATDAALRLSMLHHAASCTMTRSEMRTDFVEFRHNTLAKVEGAYGHRSEDDGRWVEESQLRNSLRREAEYGEELEREDKRMKTMGAMFVAFAKSGV